MTVTEKNSRPAIAHFKVVERFDNYIAAQAPAGNRPDPSDPRAHAVHRLPDCRRSEVFARKNGADAGSDAPRLSAVVCAPFLRGADDV